MSDVEKEVKLKLEALDVKGRIVLLQSDTMANVQTLQNIRKMLQGAGAAGVLYLPNTVALSVESIDACIAQLQKKKLELQMPPPSTKGIMTDPD